MNTNRPNILLIVTDQQRFDHLGLAGLTGISTPNLDRLGTEGVWMNRSYCTSPICTPTRLSLLTGLYPSHHGGYSIGVSPDPFPKTTVPAALSAEGYRTGIIGKTHFVARPDEEAHMAGGIQPDPSFFRDWTGPYAGFDYIQAATGHTVDHIPAMHYRLFLEDAGVDYKQWFPKMGSDYDHSRCGEWNIPPEYHDTTWVTERTREFITENAGQPWYCWAAFQDPHAPYVCPEPWYSSVDTTQMPAYEGYREGEFDDKPEIYKMILRHHYGDLDDGLGVPNVYRQDRVMEQKDKAIQATLGMIRFLDQKVGELMQTLEETGQADNTLVVFTTDHGEMHGHHGFWGKGISAYDDCQRVPLLIWGPGLFSRTGGQEALASLIDLPTTFLSLAGITDYPHTQGMDLMPFLREEQSNTQDEVIVECRPNQKFLNQVTLVTEQYKLVITKGFELGELYDLQADPDQYKNLWNDPACQRVKQELMQRLINKRMEAEPSFQPRKAYA
jgi:uncharacterized sulfatase